DLVLARDEHGSAIGLKPVKETYQRVSHHLRHLTFETPDGTQQTLSTTDEHPFWSVTAEEFVEAGSLIVGHFVTGPNGETQTLVSSVREEFPEGVPVFNFQVTDYHTYFVAASADKPVMLVHNADCTPNFPASVGSTDVPEIRGRMNTTIQGTLNSVDGVKQKIKGTISQGVLQAEELAQQVAAAKGIDNPIIRVHPGHKGVGMPHLHVDGIDGWHFWYQ
ncbi:MAG: polymorphic toxin-type HINT domain-containing protein, partial [Planctomyces sp.]